MPDMATIMTSRVSARQTLRHVPTAAPFHPSSMTATLSPPLARAMIPAGDADRADHSTVRRGGDIQRRLARGIRRVPTDGIIIT